ncbi:MAG: TonB family protein [Pseudomonadota bacterium]
MSNDSQNIVTLQLISDQTGLADEIHQQQDFTCEQVHFLNAPGEWRDRAPVFDVTLLDMRVSGNTSEDAIKHIRDVKSRNPAHAFIVIGESEMLVSLLESDVQPLIYRVFSSAISQRQVLAAIRSAGDLHRDEDPPAKFDEPVKHKTGAISNVRPRKVEPVTAPPPPAPAENVAVGATSAQASASTSPVIAPEPLPEEEFDAFFSEGEGQAEPAPVFDLFKGEQEARPAPAPLTDAPDVPSRPELIARKVDQLSEPQEPHLSRAPFLIFATVGMPSLALLAYLLLWEKSPEQPDATALLVQNPQPSAVEEPEPAAELTAATSVETPTVEPEPTTVEQTQSSTPEPTSASTTNAEAATEPVETEPNEETSEPLSTKLVESLKSVSESVVSAVNETNLPALIESDGGGEGSAIAPTTSSGEETLEQLLAWGKAAEAEGRWFEPKDNNALYFYESVLAKQSGNSTARNGRQRALSQTERSVAALIRADKLEDASDVITRFEYSHPKHRATSRYVSLIRGAVNSKVATLRANPNRPVDPTIETLNQLGPDFSRTRDSLIALKQEWAGLSEIDQSIASGILVPPDPRNAYDHILTARKKRPSAPELLNDRAATVSQQLYQRAQGFLQEGRMVDARAMLQFIEVLNVDTTSRNNLANQIARIEQPSSTAQPAQTSVAASGSTQASGETTTGEAVTEARVLEMIEPIYPASAVEQKIEGWVELAFIVDARGHLRDLSVVAEEPANIFTEAAINAIGQWAFQPAHDEIARANVDSNFSVRLDFSLPQ